MRNEIYDKKSGYAMAIGMDRILGNFIQVWKVDPNIAFNDLENLPDEYNIVVDIDGLTVDDFLDKKEEYLKKYLPNIAKTI